MFVHPNFDPIAVRLGPLAVHWYGILYLLGFWGCWWLGLRRGRMAHIQWSRERVTDFIFYGIMGVIVGGRIGYELFYNFPVFLHDPLVTLRMWEGGMSFHGGLLGVIVAYFLFARHTGLNVFDVADFGAPLVPCGLLAGRIGNFINGELWGAPTTLPWGMVFAHAPTLEPRHPTMVYEALLEGVAMLAILWWFGSKPRPRMAVAGLFLVLYALFRTLVETVRLPDAHIGYLLGTSWLTMGMLLCVPMWLGGFLMLTLAYRRKPA